MHDVDNFFRLRSIPGVGKVLAMTLLYEIHDKAKALSILAHKLGRAVYFMMKQKKPFSLEAFRLS